MEHKAREYLNQIPVLSWQAARAGALGIVRLAVKVAPDKVEEWMLNFLGQPQISAKLCWILENALKKGGLNLQIQTVNISKSGMELPKDLLIGESKFNPNGKEQLFSPDASEMLTDALAGYLKAAVSGESL